MDIILDACSIINLLNGDCFQTILSIESNTYYIGETLLEEELLNSSQKIIIETLLQEGKISLVNSDVSVKEMTELKKKYNLGTGETECLAVCKKCGYTICTDDLRARTFSAAEIGDNRVIGSLYLLRDTVKGNLMKCFEAFGFLNLMKSKGGFLPKVQKEYFCID